METQTQQPQNKNFKTAWIILGSLTALFIIILAISFSLPDSEPLPWNVKTKNETTKTVDIDIVIDKPIDSAEIVEIGSYFKKEDETGKKIVVRFFEKDATIGKDLVYANMVYPSTSQEQSGFDLKDENGSNFNMTFLGTKK